MNFPFRIQGLFVSFLTVVFLTGCGGGKKADDPDTKIRDVLERIETARQEVPDSKPVAKRIEVPRVEAWLSRKLAARYEDARADQAFQWVAQSRPVRFNFIVAEDAPRVRWSSRARTIRQHLDAIAAQADWSYVVERDVIQVYDIETRHFALATQPGSIESSLGLRNLSDAGAAQTDNTAEISFDPYQAEIRQAVEGVLGLGGDAEGLAIDPRTRVTIAPSANLLIVTARPHAMRKVERIMDRYNGSSAAIVRIELSILEVEFSDRKERDLLLQLLRDSSDLPLSVIMGLPGGLPAYVGGASSNFGILGPSDAPGRYAGSGAVIEWLDEFGEASVQFDDTVEVQNNRVASVDVTRTRQYVSKISFEVVGEGANAIATPEVEFEQLRTGLVMHLQPTLVDSRITVRMGMSRSSEVGEHPYNFSGIQGTNFVTEDFNRVLSVSLTDGEPKLLSSFSQNETRDEKRSRIPFLGPLGKDRFRRRETLLLITATQVQG
ncbi:MAG: hypothetical protein F4206_16920 [Gammaproteobacteria bacterium]|nr:hypothetical protein [Gammaproteobacteria bacterium]MYG68391.1 hypothetical protein [Gammaproteobacteria bacterium]